MENKKIILDACCSGRMMWLNKKHPNAIYIDNRKEEKGFVGHERARTFEINPDIVMDFRKMDFPDKTFKAVFFDPPHLKRCGKNSVLGKKFGILNSKTWQEDLRKGFEECWRVLDDFGSLVFKWSDHDIKLKEILQLLPQEPIICQRSTGGKHASTFWMFFMKIPK